MMPTDRDHITLARMEEMRLGARTAAQVCLGIGANDRVFVLTDQATHGIGRLLAEEAAEDQAQVVLQDLEQFGERPLKVLPESLRTALLEFHPTVTFFAASALPTESAFRTGLRVFLQRDLAVRHAHMPGVDSRVMAEGMRADYRRVARLTRSIYDMARLAEKIHVTTPDGTDLEAVFDPGLRWVPVSGLYHRQGAWGGLPGGETYSCPLSVDGALAAHVIGEPFAARCGVLPAPVLVTVQRGNLSEICSPDPSLAAALRDHLDSVENGARVGKFAIGANYQLRALCGNLLQDVKVPGAHLAFGSPFPSETGASWSSPIHLEMVPFGCTVSIDGETIIRDGRLDYDLLGVPEPR